MNGGLGGGEEVGVSMGEAGREVNFVMGEGGEGDPLRGSLEMFQCFISTHINTRIE